MRQQQNSISDGSDHDSAMVSSRSWPEIILGLITVPCVTILYIESLSFRKMDWEPLGMAFWPRVVLIGLGVMAILFIIQGVRNPGDTEPLKVGALVPWLVAAAFTALLLPLGATVAGFLLVSLSSWYLYPRNSGNKTRLVYVALANGLGTMVLIHLIFGAVLGMRLPTGALGF